MPARTGSAGVAHTVVVGLAVAAVAAVVVAAATVVVVIAVVVIAVVVFAVVPATAPDLVTDLAAAVGVEIDSFANDLAEFHQIWKHLNLADSGN